MGERLKVLISAYACEPNKGSEPEVGWQWALQMARFHDVTVLTRANNRPAIEAALESLRGIQPLPKFVYHDRSALFLDMKRRAKAIKLYYVLWQRSAREIVRQLHEANQFDLMHHVTFAGYRYPIAIWGHGVPAIWGPIGGIESIPTALLPWHHPLSLAYEGARNINNLLQATPIHVLPKRARASTIILACTPEMKHAFDRLGFASELMATIGLKAAELPYRPPKRGPGPLRMLFVGNVITLKGIDLAIEALAQSGTNATLTIVGDGNYLGAARQLAESVGLQDRVKFTGRKPRTEVLTIYPDYDLFLFPSLHDTGGYAVIEAMLNELPVICLNCGGPAVAVTPKCGTRVELGSRRQVIAGLSQSFREYDRDRSKLESQGKAARERVLNDYDWDHKGVQMDERYRRAVALYKQKERLGLGSKKAYSGMGGFATFMHQMFSLRGVVAGLLLMILIGALGFFSLGHLRFQAGRIVNDTLPGLAFSGEVSANLASAYQCTTRYVMSQDPVERAELREKTYSYSRMTSSYLTTYKQQIYDEQDRLLFAALIERRKEYLAVRERVFDLAESNRQAEAMTVFKNELAKAYENYKAAGQKLFEYNIREGKSRGTTIMKVCTITEFIVAGIGIAVFFVGFIAGLFK